MPKCLNLKKKTKKKMKKNNNSFLVEARNYLEERKRFIASELFVLRPRFKEYSQKTFQLQRRIEQLERELKHLEKVSDPGLFE